MKIKMKRIGKRKVVCEQKCFFAGCSFSCDMPCFEVGSDETDARIERIASTLASLMEEAEEKSAAALRKISEEYSCERGVARRVFLHYDISEIRRNSAEKCKSKKRASSDCGGCIEYLFTVRTRVDGRLEDKLSRRLCFRLCDGYLCAAGRGK